MDTTKLIAKRIRDTRRARDWSQEFLAEKTDLTPRTISNVERGKAIQLSTLLAIASAFECELADLLTE